jgi:Spx/MgsR family transcriptional regulator
MPRIYGLANCTTCQKAMTWLDAKEVRYRFIDYRAEPIATHDIESYAAQSGWEKLVNRASMTWRNLAEADKSPQNDRDWLKLVTRHPTLIRRPLLVLPDGRTISGFSEKRYSELL